jgi:CheY-like chemotaxis protein
MPVSPAPHVVILDELPLYAEVYRYVFAGEGYRVTTLTDCAVEPAAVLGMLPDLIVLDLQCGRGLRGLDFLRQLREDPTGRELPVVASTPASLIDIAPYETELRALGAAIFDGNSMLADLLAAAGAAIERAREVRRRSEAALDRLRARREHCPPI